MQSPAVADRFQFPDTDCDVAVECALGSAIVPPHTSCTQDNEAPSTHPDTQETEESTVVTVANEQEALPDFVPTFNQVQERTALLTVADAPCPSAGTAYPFTVPDEQPAEVQIFPPSTNASEVPGAFIRPATEPDDAG